MPARRVASRPNAAPTTALAAALIVTGCGGGVDGAASPRASASAAPTIVSATAVSALPPPGSGRTPLGTTTKVVFESTLLPIEGRDAALAVADAAGARAAYLQVVEPSGPSGPILTLPGAHVVAAYADGDATLLLTTQAGRLCKQRWLSTGPEAASCREVDADLVVRFGAQLVAIDARTPAPEDEDAKATQAGQAQKPTPNRPKTKPKPKPAKPRAKAKAKPKPKPLREAEAKKRLMESGREVEIVAEPWDRPVCPPTKDGEPEPEGCGPIASGLRYREAMAGLSLIGAHARSDKDGAATKLDLVFYERAEPKGSEQRAKIGLGTLDAELAAIEGTRRSYGESKLEPGFLADHSDLRVVRTDGGAIALGLRGPRGKCDVTVIAPFVMQMIPDAADCALDPRRFLRVARAKNKGDKLELGPAPALDASRVRRAPFQATWDVGHVVYGTDHAFAREGDKLVTFTTGGEVARVDAPLTTERLRLHWAAFARDGAALAETDQGLVAIDANGKLAGVTPGEARGLYGPDRADVAAAQRTPAVRIGGTFFQARGALRPLWPTLGPAKRALAYDAAVLAGGAKHGLLFEARGDALAIARVTEDGAEAPIGVVDFPAASGLDAVERAAGGALVVAPDPKDAARARVLVVDATGRIATAAPVTLAVASRYLRLVARPGGGAWLFDEARSQVVWLDDDGAALGQAAMPAAKEGACIDGRPVPERLPGALPKSFVATGAGAGSCIVGDAAIANGELRWLGSTVAGPHARAELAVAPVDGTAEPDRAVAALAFRAPDAITSAHCPPDMVFVSGGSAGLCVDRYESTLRDETTGRLLSPDYPASPNLLASVLGDFATRRELTGDLYARALPLPELSAWQRNATLAPASEVRAGVVPSGYVTGLVARDACERAGKRLCKLDEWKRACRGEKNTIYPYGPSWEDGACNVNGFTHPAVLLHDNASVGHLDPRLNRVGAAAGTQHASDATPLLHRTGASPRCASRWGDDAIYDMVGNVDEWVDEGRGAFAGGFYARTTTSGCEALVAAHPYHYLDYSTGVRCCKDAE